MFFYKSYGTFVMQQRTLFSKIDAILLLFSDLRINAHFAILPPN